MIESYNILTSSSYIIFDIVGNKGSIHIYITLPPLPVLFRVFIKVDTINFQNYI